MQDEPTRAPSRPELEAGLAAWIGFSLIALTNAGFIAFGVPLPASVGLRVKHHVFDATGTLGVGLVAAIVVGAGTALVLRGARAFGRRRAWIGFGLLAYAAIAGWIMHELIDYQLERFTLILFSGRLRAPLFVLAAAASAMIVPALHVAGALASRRRALRLVALVVALGGMIGNHLFLRDDYPGVHGAIAWLSATLAGSAAAPFVEAKLRSLRGRTRAAFFALAASAGLFGILVPPAVSVRVELFREPCAVAAWVLARTTWPLPGKPRIAPPPEITRSPFFHAREGLTPILPTNPPLLAAKAPIVVLITVDATRADAIDGATNDRLFPTLARMKAKGASFTRASAPGSQTAVSLASMFSSRYFSQLVYQLHGKGPTRFAYPAADPSPRFPELLARRGVATASFCGILFLANEFGVARGFVEETLLMEGRGHAKAEQVMRPLLERLDRAGDEPLFVYAHLLEPHAPYDRGAKTGTAKARYLSEIGVVDRWLGKVVELLDRRFAGRAILIVTSDHGEAFGEHGTTLHSKTLYDELLRVPLLVRGPGVVARRIEERVSLVDIGPTILDIFGVETPASYLGQSLVPLLAGSDVHLERPVLAEGRLRRALYAGELKIIDDPRRKVVEAFDLERDPRELHNLFDRDRSRVAPALSTLRLFFDVHRASAPGYVPPYRR